MLQTLSCFALVLCLTTELATAQSPTPNAHWAFDQDHFEDGHFLPIAGDWALPYSGMPDFLGQKAQAALLWGKDAVGLTLKSPIRVEALPIRSLTAMAWVAIDKSTEWGGIIGAFEDNGEEELGWLLGYRNKRFTMALSSEKHPKLLYLSTQQPFRSGVWHHVAGTYDGKSLRIYVDGKLEAQSEKPGGDILYNAAHQFVVGAYLDKNESHPMTGAIREASFYSACLSPKRIARLAKKRNHLPVIIGGRATPKETNASLAEMQPRINLAIQKAENHLLHAQNRDGSWGGMILGYRNGMTSLCLYALLESGVPASHPAIQNGMNFLLQELPEETYSAGLELLALAALNDPAFTDVAADIVNSLLDWEDGTVKGTWAYPNGKPDLSNTQFAALGFWAAQKMGVSVSEKVWRRIIDTTAKRCLSELSKVENQGASTSTRFRKIGGFTYYPNDTVYPTYGAMTAAGISVLQLAQQANPNLGPRERNQIQEATELALGWLDHHWTVEECPGYPESLYYYLYALERVGSLLQTDKIGPHLWYEEGALVLLDLQAESGAWEAGAGWPSGRHTESNTAFALLFLNRSTSAVAVSGAAPRPRNDFHQLDAGPIQFAVSGEQKITLWIRGLRDAETSAIQQVAYSLDQKNIGVVEQDHDGTHRWAMQYPALTPGRHTFGVKVQLTDGRELSSESLAVETVVSPRWFQERALLQERSMLWPQAQAQAKASSTLTPTYPPAFAIDGLQATAWLCTKDEKQPTLQINLARPMKASAVLLSPPDASLANRGRCDQVQDVIVIVNRKQVFEATFAKDGLSELVVPFAKPLTVRHLEIKLVSRAQGKQLRGHAGLAEVTLLE